jgi:hypothetical protein
MTGDIEAKSVFKTITCDAFVHVADSETIATPERY